MYNCPHCNKQVKNLKKHVKRMHPEKAEDPKPQEVKVKAKPLELKVPTQLQKEKEKPDPEPEPETKGYHCIDCGAAVSKGQNPCPGCGVQLDWSKL